MTLRISDPEIWRAVRDELVRQQNTLDLIASENYASEAILEAQASVLTNKYAEGYPGKRYYGGCEFVDTAEDIARRRAMELFGAEYANVQPHSGSQANTAIYLALLKPGDTVMGLMLSHGGHLTHGSPANISGQLYNFIAYGVSSETEQLDYDDIRRLALEHKPRMIVTGASAYPRIINFEAFRSIADEVGAYLMVDMAHIAGLVAAGAHPSPVPYSDVVASTTHKTLRGPRGGLILAREKYGKALDKAVFPGTQGGPLMHTIAAKAVCFKEAMAKEFKVYSEQIVINARAMAATLIERGFRICSGGTDTHLMLVDLTNKGITGLDAEQALASVGIIANKNTIPFETRSASVTSGIRLGTPAITTRGLKEEETRHLAHLIADTLEGMEDEDTLRRVAAEVKQLCKAHPIYTGINKELVNS
ncbi:MAG TPA: serine hydroxymethyltransferase [Anaerolineae bacterium]|nr:serine hydroxymethyltransferase [Anaerolineae bacterium]